ncbi:MAG: pentapeptide repeat-containing protein [Pseudonocardiales bacterium]
MLAHADLKANNFDRADFTGADLTGCDLDSASLPDAVLADATLGDARGLVSGPVVVQVEPERHVLGGHGTATVVHRARRNSRVSDVTGS